MNREISLTVSIGGLNVSLPITFVRSVERMVYVDPFPHSDPAFFGTIQFEGRTIPVLDPRGRFGQPAKSLEASDFLVILDLPARMVALWVDGVKGLETLGNGKTKPAKHLPGAPFAEEIYETESGILYLHDPSRFLSIDESRKLDEHMEGL